jgi:cell fate (sporulation/competence/biofilm development) regulator YlbF (YheA/YmcA/DUF963 family)
MEIYDTANRLAEEIKNSDQYKNLKIAKENINSNPEKKSKVEEFENLKQEVQLMEVRQQNN